jgi:hypothetical protein
MTTWQEVGRLGQEVGQLGGAEDVRVARRSSGGQEVGGPGQEVGRFGGVEVVRIAPRSSGGREGERTARRSGGGREVERRPEGRKIRRKRGRANRHASRRSRGRASRRSRGRFFARLVIAAEVDSLDLFPSCDFSRFARPLSAISPTSFQLDLSSGRRSGGDTCPGSARPLLDQGW